MALTHEHRRNREATDPVNAALNYCYSLAEAECRTALIVLGLDPGLGVLHADKPGRDSLALDLMEALRPAVDRAVIRCLGIDQHRGSRRIPSSWFRETRTGQVLLKAPLSHELAEHLPRWGSVVQPYARQMGEMFTAVAERGITAVLRTADSPYRRRVEPPRKVTRFTVRVPTDVVPAAGSVDDALAGLSDERLARLLEVITSAAPDRGSRGRPRTDDTSLAAGLWVWCHGHSIGAGLGVSRTTVANRVQEWKRAGVWPEIRDALHRESSMGG